MTTIIQTLAEWRSIRSNLGNAPIGLVPTMGNLHAGHGSLLKRSMTENQNTVLSIFTNPTQFDEVTDFQQYPKTLEADIQLAQSLGVNWVLTPTEAELYPDNYRYRVMETEQSQTLCGKVRSGHFMGVLTVVLKLLQWVKPQRAYFGEKDFQQLQLIRGMAEAFFLETEIVACATVRDSNGLALSSRNQRLSPAQYQLALAFPSLLATVFTDQEIVIKLTELGFEVDYIKTQEGRRFGAVRVGGVRLIDNF